MNKEIEDFMASNVATFAMLDDGDEREVWHDIEKEDNIAYRLQFAIGDGEVLPPEELLYVQELEDDDDDAVFEILGLTITDRYLRLANRRPENYTFVQLHNRLAITYNADSGNIEFCNTEYSIDKVAVPIRFFVADGETTDSIAMFFVRFLSCISEQNEPDAEAYKRMEAIYLNRQKERKCLFKIQELEEDLKEKRFYQSHFLRSHRFGVVSLVIVLFALVCCLFFCNMAALWFVAIVVLLFLLVGYLLFCYGNARRDINQLELALDELKKERSLTEDSRNITKRKRASLYVA